MHFLVRLILKVFFPLKATHTLTDAQITNVRSKYGFKTVLIVIVAGIFIFSTIVSLMSTAFSWFYPGEKQGCFYCYDNSAIMEICLAIPLGYFILKALLHQLLGTDYEDVKLYWSVKNGYNVSRAVKTIVLLVFLLGSAFSFSSMGSSVRFCADSFEAKNFAVNEKGDKIKGPVNYKYKDILRSDYCYTIHTNKDGSSYDNFSHIALQLTNGDKIELHSHNFGEGSNNVQNKVIDRIMKATGATEMDTVLVDS